MNRFGWKETVNKTKWASGRKRLTKRELGELAGNVTALERFMAGNKSENAGADRSERFNKRPPKG